MFNLITSLSITARAAPATGADDNHVVIYTEPTPLPLADITRTLGRIWPGSRSPRRSPRTRPVLLYGPGLNSGGKRCCDLSQRPAIRVMRSSFINVQHLELGPIHAT